MRVATRVLGLGLLGAQAGGDPPEHGRSARGDHHGIGADLANAGRIELGVLLLAPLGVWFGGILLTVTAPVMAVSALAVRLVPSSSSTR